MEVPQFSYKFNVEKKEPLSIHNQSSLSSSFNKNSLSLLLSLSQTSTNVHDDPMGKKINCTNCKQCAAIYSVHFSMSQLVEMPLCATFHNKSDWYSLIPTNYCHFAHVAAASLILFFIFSFGAPINRKSSSHFHTVHLLYVV